MSAPILSVRDLSFAYGGGAPSSAERVPGSRGVIDALRDVTFDVVRGTHTGIVGPNGAGKSTLLRLLAGFVKPDRGELLLDGSPLLAMKRLALARRVAYVPQSAPTDIPFTALEVALAGRFPHVGWFRFEGERDIAIARAALARLDAERLASRRFSELSGGEQARVLVARALAQEPELLLLDEPTAFLDVGHRLDLYDRLREENKARGLTVVVVTHDLNMASEYCDRLVLLDAGRVTAQGTPVEVLTADRIASVYGCRVSVDTNPATGSPRVTPLPRHAG